MTDQVPQPWEERDKKQARLGCLTGPARPSARQSAHVDCMKKCMVALCLKEGPLCFSLDNRDPLASPLPRFNSLASENTHDTRTHKCHVNTHTREEREASEPWASVHTLPGAKVLEC